MEGIIFIYGMKLLKLQMGTIKILGGCKTKLGEGGGVLFISVRML